MSAHNIITIVELIVLIIWTIALREIVDVENTNLQGTVVFTFEDDEDEDGESHPAFSEEELTQFAQTTGEAAKSVYLLGLWSILAIPIHFVAWFAGVIVNAVT